MDSAITNAFFVLLGTIVGAGAGVVGNVVAARTARHNEVRRLGIEAGLREWERMHDYGVKRGNAAVFPPALFMYYSVELVRLLDEQRLTPETYRDLMTRRDLLRGIIREESERRLADCRDGGE